MEKKTLRFETKVKALTVSLLVVAIGMIHGYSQNFTFGDLNYSVNSDGTSVTLRGHISGTSAFGELTIPETVTYMENSYTVTTIGVSAFNNCCGFSGELIIPNSITTIGSNAFESCSGFTGRLVLGNSIKTINSYAFYGCSGLTSISIPNSVCIIGYKPFYGTGWYEQQPSGFLYLDNWCLGYKGEEPTGSLILLEGTKGIATGAFQNCKNLTNNLVIPNSVITIGNSAFKGCTGFTSDLNIPNSVKLICDYAFQGCTGFTGNLNISNSVETIGDYAFSQCSGLSGSLIIPNSVTTIGEGAFRECSGFNGSLVISDSIVTINRTTFQDCNGFTGSLTIPNTVTTIGGYAFYNCSGFNGTLIFGDSLTTIGEVAFRNCYGFTGILTIPSAVTTIGYRAFYSCYGFDGIRLSNSVTSIGDNCFVDCRGFIGALIIPNSVLEIGEYAFRYCSGLTSVTIGNSLTSLKEGLFDSCTSLVSITMGRSVDSIGNNFAYDCRNLNTITLLSIEPPALPSYAIPFSYNSNKTIFVPYESLNTYKTATNWSSYSSKILPMSYTTIPSYSADADNWHFIASPLVEETTPTAVENLIAETPYDLYQFNQSAADGEWQNYKANNFNFANGQGYLYANAEDVNIIFKGTFNEDDTKEVSLAYDANANLAGWNLVGNPFPVSAYANRSYYVMNEEGTAIEPVAVSMETAIPACTGVMVKAENTGESVTFCKTAPVEGTNQGVLQIAVAQANTRAASIVDKAIVSFNAGDKLEKYVFNKDNAQLYIPRGENNYAIVSAEKTGEMPLNFEAKKNGIYTLTVDAELADMEYLHLIDNLTGDNVDLLTQPAYTFEAKTTDYASRFKLVFSVSGDADGDDDSFAFFNGSAWTIANEGSTTLQVVDMLGHVISSETINGNATFSTDGFSAGVYMMRLMNGEKVKVQKVVVR